MNDWSSMGGLGFADGLFLAVSLILFLYPIGRILRRLGYSPLWSLAVFVPLFNLVLLWLLAFADWPSRQRNF